MLVSFGLMVLFPLLHSLFGFQAPEAQTTLRTQSTVMEVVKKEEDKPKQQQQRIRKVSTTASRSSSGSGQQQQMRFTPDLSADGGGGGDGVALAQQELAVEVFEEGQTDQDAVPVQQAAISYPQRARELAVEGSVEVVFVVTHEGRTAQIDVLRAPHPTLAAEVRRVVATWKFKPAFNKGVPVSVRMKQTIDFKLD
jgi:TonB family protein